jgi:bacterioferritin
MNEEFVAMLKLDMMGEHQAIIQYLRHAYAMGEVPLAYEVEAIARDEMRHLDWLADLIVEAGGEPTMERAPVDMTPGSVPEQMLKDVAAEQTAIDLYRHHLAASADPHARTVLGRILHDELSHQEQFRKFAAEAEAEALQNVPVSEPTGEPGERVAAILNEGVRHEYTVTLQYLYHGFLAKNCDLREEMQNIAINEMQHIGWLAEALVGRNGTPDLNHLGLTLTADPEKMLKADIAAERAVTHDYTEQLSELTDPKLQGLLGRIRDHEIYHDATFGALLDEVEAEEGETEVSGSCADTSPAFELPAVPPATPPVPPTPAPPSVGSLIGPKK